MQNSDSSVSIIVPSCDAYSDLWPTWIAALEKFWPDCPYPIYFISNFQSFIHPRVTSILVGEDISWSTNLRAALKQIPGEYHFMMLEDLFLSEKVNTTTCIKLFRWASDNHAAYLRLLPLRPHHRFTRADVNQIQREEPYWTSTVMSLWKREALDALLVDGENAWEFEVIGTLRAQTMFADDFYMTTRPHFALINGVVKRVWNPGSVRALRRRGLAPALGKRAQMTRFEHVLWFAKAVLFNLWINATALRPTAKRRRQFRVL